MAATPARKDLATLFSTPLSLYTAEANTEAGERGNGGGGGEGFLVLALALALALAIALAPSDDQGVRYTL